MMGASDALLHGLDRPVADSQRVFRGVLHAMAYPGTPVDFSPVSAPPVELMPATTLVLLTLTDAQTPVWWAPSATCTSPKGWLRFHTGAPSVDTATQAAFAVVHGPLPDLDLADFDLGSDEKPEQSCTLLWQVQSLDRGVEMVWSGPGICAPRKVCIDGVPNAFWAARALQQSGFPRGVDVLLLCGNRCMGLPRTTHVSNEGEPLNVCGRQGR